MHFLGHVVHQHASLPASTPSPVVSLITANRRPASGLLSSWSGGSSLTVKSSLGRWLQVASALSGPAATISRQ